MNSKFIQICLDARKHLTVLSEAAPPPPPREDEQSPETMGEMGAEQSGGAEETPGLPDMGSALPGMDGGGPPGGGAPGGDAAGGGETSGGMDNKTKRTTDPIGYTEATLKTMVDPSEGITPDMFAQYIDTFKMKGKAVMGGEGVSKYYKNFFTELQRLLRVSDRLNSMYKNIHTSVSSMAQKPTKTPDNTSQGVGQNPAGPGVK